MSLTTWHKDIKSWKNINQFLFKNETMSDCSFLVKEGKSTRKIPAHKYILGGYSPEFYNLFYLMVANSNEIPIDEFSVKSVTSFLEFLYTEKTEMSMENIGDLFKLAERYSVECLKTACGGFLLQNITVDNVLSVLDTYSIYELPELETECLKVISSKPLCFEDPSFFEISNRTLTTILKSEELTNDSTENIIFEATNKWTERYCAKIGKQINSANKRLALGDALQYIRFGAMTISEFTTCSNFDNSILTPTETVEIYQFLGSDGKLKCKYSSKKRLKDLAMKFVLQKKPVVSLTETEWFGGIFLALRFTVNKPIFFHGFEMYGRGKSFVEYQNPEKFFIQFCDKWNFNLMTQTVEIKHDGSTRTYEVLFGEKKLLAVNEPYDIYISKATPGALFTYHAIEKKGDYSSDIGFNISFSNGMFIKIKKNLKN